MLTQLIMSLALLAGALPDQEMQAQLLYVDAVGPAGDEAKIDRAEGAYKTLLDGHPEKLGYRLRLASLTASRATYAWMPWTKSKYSSAAVEQFDALAPAVRSAKDPVLTYEFHFYRGVTYRYFPGFLGKRQIAIEDLAEAARLEGGLSRPTPERAQLYLAYAHALSDEGRTRDAQRAARQALGLATDEATRTDALRLTQAE